MATTTKKSWKDLVFINHDEKKEEGNGDQKKAEPKYTSKFPETNSFPSSTPVIETPPLQTSNIPLECAPHMENIMKTYEEGFAKLNKPGIEFFEFYEAVLNAGSDNPGSYRMALKMLSGMEKSMTKDSLVTQSQFYIDELTKVHDNFNAIGNQKKSDIITQKKNEQQQLTNDVKLLKQQMEAIKDQIAKKEDDLSKIDTKYQSNLQELDCKIMANDEAEKRILSSINTVVNGIKQNL